MRANLKLTKIVAGRTISPPTIVDDKLHFVLDDGSAMDVTAAPGFVYLPGKGGTITKVQQQDTDLVFVLADSTSISIKTADASSSIFMRDKTGAMAYAG